MRRLFGVAALGTGIALGALPFSPAHAARRPPTKSANKPIIVVYGDSLAWESQDFITFFLTMNNRATVNVRTFPGTAMCDWFDEMTGDANRHPKAVIVAFSGAALTPCMSNTSGKPMTGADLVAKYKADSERALSIFGSSTEVFFTGYPISRTADADPDGQMLRNMYKSLPSDHPSARWNDAGVLIVNEQGHYTDTKPCLPFEPCPASGQSVVRAPDGGHFCPIAHDDGRYQCSMWSSGAFRYGLMMTLPLMTELKL
jgi:predicted alpha/beta hydrolase family esterase